MKRILLLIILCFWAICASAYTNEFIGAVASGGGDAWIFEDNFGSDTSTSYSKIIGSQALIISSGYATTATFGAETGYYPTTTPIGNNQIIQARISSGSANADVFGLIFRVTPGATPTAYVLKTNNNARMALYTLSGTTETFAAWFTYTGGKTWAVDTFHIIRITINGTSISLAIDWDDDGLFTSANENDMSVTNASIAAGTYAGFLLDTAGDNPHARVDYIKIKAY